MCCENFHLENLMLNIPSFLCVYMEPLDATGKCGDLMILLSQERLNAEQCQSSLAAFVDHIEATLAGAPSAPSAQ